MVRQMTTDGQTGRRGQRERQLETIIRSTDSQQ